MHQRWEQLLFLHWQVEIDAIQRTLPPGLWVDTFEGQAFIGVVPFLMRGVRPHGLPTVSGISNFLELNLRTYVHDREGRPGVWFYSLDANQWMAVRVARKRFSLPYVDASMRVSGPGPQGEMNFRSRRRTSEEMVFQYRPDGEVYAAEPGTMTHFLVERYYLYAFRQADQQLLVGQVHHRPYPLQPAEVENYASGLFSLNGFTEPQEPPCHAVMSPGVAVEIFGLEKAGGRSPERSMGAVDSTPGAPSQSGAPLGGDTREQTG